MLLAFLPVRGWARWIQVTVQVECDLQKKGPHEIQQESNHQASSEPAEQAEPTQNIQAPSSVSPSPSSKDIKSANTPNRQSSPDSVIPTSPEPIISSQLEPFDPSTPGLEPVSAPPKRLGLAITGTALVGAGLYALGIYFWGLREQKRQGPAQGAVIPIHGIFRPIGGVMVATGGLMAIIGWIQYAHWKRWSRLQQSTLSSQQLGMNPMLRLKLHRPRWNAGFHEPSARQLFGFSWSGRF